MFIKTKFAAAVSVASLLAACGGGGGDAGSTTAPTAPVNASFPIQGAVISAYLHGLQQTLNVTGFASSGAITTPITGALTFTIGQPLSTTFNGAAALQVTQTITGSVVINGQSTPLNSTGNNLLSPSYAEVGSTGSGSYCVASTPGAFPATASAGQTGSIVAKACYADSSKSFGIGTETQTYATKAGSAANTLDFQIIDNVYNAGGTLTETSALTYTINSAGVPTLTQVQLQGSASGVSINLTAK
ncbi:hypothetical protein [Rugamonas sp.]|uniref:hypothetical protein n=1 Tax=Rugamonas sp. TaxID=1926287 RepID=UPI0025DB7486|nr:hypothetical protein [Rugamonas sp.]